MPVSATVKCSDASLPSESWTSTVDDDLAALGELDGVADQVDEHLAKPSRIAEDGRRHVRLDVTGQLEALLVRARRQQPDRLLHGLAQVERHPLERQLPRLDLREVENVVDERQQRLGRVLHRPQVLALLRGQLRPERQLRHADDAVHRRADLMAHVRQELALGGRRLLGDELGDLELADELRQPFGVGLLFAPGRLQVLAVPLQRVLAALALGDVAGVRVDRAQFGQRRRVPQQPPVGSVAGAVAVFEVAHPHAGGQRRHRRDGGLAILGMDEIEKRSRHHLLAGVAEGAFPGGIHAREVPVEGRDALEIEGDGEESVELLFGALAVDEQANLAPDRAQHPQEIRLRLTHLAREELHDRQHGAAAQDGKPERAMQAGPAGGLRPGEVRVVRHVGNPDRLRPCSTPGRAARCPA